MLVANTFTFLFFRKYLYFDKTRLSLRNDALFLKFGYIMRSRVDEKWVSVVNV